jgi:hypothetical protein
VVEVFVIGIGKFCWRFGPGRIGVVDDVVYFNCFCLVIFWCLFWFWKRLGLVPNLIGIGMNLLYLFKSPLIFDSSRNSSESSAMCRMISVPRVVLSEALE